MFTLYPAVNAILEETLAGAQAALGGQFTGMYLYGSLSSGDFNPATSDIDFVVVTDGELPAERVAALEAMHQRLWDAGSYWAAHLEGTYIPGAAWRRYDPGMPPVPLVNEGRFYIGGHGSDWIIQRQVVRAGGVTLAGPPAASLIDPVAPAALRQAVVGTLHEAWEPILDDPALLQRAAYQAFAVLTMCRALYALEHGAMVSKPAAARWASTTQPAGWHSLIQQAAAWRPGQQIGPLEATQAFIRYTLTTAAAA
jgi:hypothetical protein